MLRQLLIGAVTTVTVMGCADAPRHLSADEFCALAAEPEMGSMRYVRPLGLHGERAVLELHEMSTVGGEWGVTTYWSEVEGLSAGCRARVTGE